MSRKYDFSQKIKNEIMKKAGYCCSNPTCRIPVDEKVINSYQKPSGSGEIAHIYDAAQKVQVRELPKTMDKSFLNSEENAMLLCRICHSKIDTHAHIGLYPPEILFSYKEEIEEIVRNFLFKLQKDYKQLNNIEKNMLQECIQKSRRKLPDIEYMSDDEVIFENLKNAVHRVTLNLSVSDVGNLKNEWKLLLNRDQFFFGEHLDKRLKEIFKSGKLIIYEEIDIMIRSKYNKKFNKVINKCVVEKFNNKIKIKQKLFDKNNELHEFVFLIYEMDFITNETNFLIDISVENLKNKKINLRESSAFGELKDFLDLMINDKISILMKKGLDEWKIINDYDCPILNYDSISNHVVFLATLENLAKIKNIDLYIDQSLYDNHRMMLIDSSFFYNALVNNEMNNSALIYVKDTLAYKNDLIYYKFGLNYINENSKYFKVYNYNNMIDHFINNYSFEFIIKNLIINVEMKNILLFFNEIEVCDVIFKTAISEMNIYIRRI